MGEPETRGPQACTCTSYPLKQGGRGENRAGGYVKRRRRREESRRVCKEEEEARIEQEGI